MVWTASRTDLLAAVAVLDLVPSKSGVPASDYFLVKRSSNLSTISLKTACEAVAEVSITGTGKWPYETFYLKRSEFTPWVSIAKELDKFDFEFSIKGKTGLHVKHGFRSYDFDDLPSVMGFSTLANIKTETLEITPALVEMMLCSANCAADVEEAAHLSCVYMTPSKSGVELYSSNQPVILKMRSEEGKLKEPIPFPISMIGVLKASGLVSLEYGSKCVVANFKNGKVWQTVSPQANENFPIQEIQKVLNSSKGKSISISSVRLCKLMERLATCMQMIAKPAWVINMAGEAGQKVMKITIRLPDATLRDQITCVNPLPVSVNFEWPLHLLAPIFEFISRGEENKEMSIIIEKEKSFVSFDDLKMCIFSRAV